MGKKSPFQWICMVAFAAFAAISCYFTVSSLFLALSDIPKWCFWIAVVGLYILTAYGSKMVWDSFNKHLMIDNRTAKFVGGLIIVVVTWLLVSFPTNVHSLFYGKMAKQTAKSEQQYLISELEKLTNEEMAVIAFNADFENKITAVRSKKASLYQEIKHPERPGVGPRVDSCLQAIEIILEKDMGTIHRLGHTGTNLKAINEAIKYYDAQIEAQIKNEETKQAKNLAEHLVNFNKEAQKLNLQIKAMNENISDIENGTHDSEKVLVQSRSLIKRGYNTLENKGIKENYSGYKSERLVNVIEVWGDLFKGEFKDKNYGLVYWILLSLVIDLAAFCFFNVE